MKKKLMLMLSCLFLSIGYLAAQTKISGHVVDETGEPLISVSVVAKGTTVGTLTDLDGNFTLDVPAGKKVIEFRLVGMKRLELPMKKELNVVMEEDNAILDEVIVVAYGTAKRSAFTGSAGVVSSEDILKRQTTNVASALTGQVAGVQVMSANGQPGEKPDIRIRGVGSFSAGNDPLYVVDGMPFDGDVSSLNSADIATMTVLKDAASNALYGARGANGVILITTKIGETKEALVKVDAKWGGSRKQLSNYDRITNTGTHYEQMYKAIYNGRKTAGDTDANAHKFVIGSIFDADQGGTGYPIYTTPNGEDFILPGGKLNPNATLGYSDGNYYLKPDNWEDELIKGGLRQEYNVSISGRSDNVNYYLSAGYLDEKGLIENSGFKRFTTRMKVDYQAKKWLKVVSNINYTNYTSNYPGTQTSSGSSANIFYVANMMAPIYPLYVRNANGDIMKDRRGYTIYDFGDGNGFEDFPYERSFMGQANPGAVVELNKRSYKADVFSGRWAATADIYDGLRFSGSFGMDLDNTRYNNLYNTYYGQYASGGGYISLTSSKNLSMTSQFLLTYNKAIGKHNFDVVLGNENYRYRAQDLSGQVNNAYHPTNAELGNAVVTPSVESKTNKYATIGYFVRGQYDYDGEYFGSFSYRRDGSSRFHKDNRWGNFWSVSGAWILTKNLIPKQKWLDLLKVKASYGVQGNDDLRYSGTTTSNYYPYLDQYNLGVMNGEKHALEFNYKGNKDITWESSHSFNVGVEFDFFKGKLAGGLEYYSRKTKDMLYFRPMPPSGGYSEFPMNIGSVTNNGVELDLRSQIFKNKDLEVNFNLNMTYAHNKINKLHPEIKNGQFVSGSRIYKEGRSMYQLNLKKYAGVDKTDGTSQWYKDVKDANGEVIGRELTKDWDLATEYESGDLMPALYGGFGPSVTYKGIDFSMAFSYQLGGRLYDNTYAALMHGGRTNNSGTAWHKDILKAWTPENTNSNVPRLNQRDLNSNGQSTRFLVSSNYLNLQNISIGYTFPKQLLSKIHLGSLRIYAVADNVALIAARKGMDPRKGLVSTGSYSYAAMRSISGGLSITF